MSSLVYLKNANGKTYVYENTSYKDAATNTFKQRRKCIGHLDPETGEVVPNRKKGDRARNQAPKTQYYSKTIGPTRLFDWAVEQTGLDKALRKVFPDLWREMLTVAYYLASEGSALSRADAWARDNETPYEGSLASQRISELLTRITPDRQQEFFAVWAGMNRQDDYFALDITSVSSYSRGLEMVKYGYNRDKEKLPQINMLMVTGERSRMPVYYRIMDGALKDSSTLKMALRGMGDIVDGNLKYVMDKGFYSEGNIEEFYRLHKKFLVGVPFTTRLAREAVERSRDSIENHRNYLAVGGDRVYAVTETVSWKGHRMYVHVYFDPVKAAEQASAFDFELHKCHQELLNGERVKAHGDCYKKFFHVRETPKRGVRVEFNEEAIAEHKRTWCGWLVLAGNMLKESGEALSVYREKDAVEKCFDDLKNDLDMKRLRIHSVQALDGRVFLQFLSLIVTTRLKQTLREAGWLENTSLQEVISEMKSYREIGTLTKTGRKRRGNAVPTSKQKKILELFGL